MVLVALLLASGLLAPPALADAIGPPPATCPRGSIGRSSHAGAYCAATTCSVDADCERQSWGSDRRRYVCQPDVALCVGTKDVTSPRARRGLNRTIVDIGVGACDAACVAPATCQTARRCVEAASPAPAPTGTARPSGARACACHAGPTGGEAAPWAALVGLAAASAGRRRARRR